MFNKLKHLYPRSIMAKNISDIEMNSNFHWFSDHIGKEWIGIPHIDISEKELLILKTIFHYHEPSGRDSRAQSWYHFLFLNGQVPNNQFNSRIRIIHFQCSGSDWDRQDLEHALLAFFSDEAILLWENSHQGLIISGEYENALTDEDFYSLCKTVESDFYLKIFLFIGKFHEPTIDIRPSFSIERTFFFSALANSPRENVYTFEKLYPVQVTAQLGDELIEALTTQILKHLYREEDLLLTVKVFLENNLNVSLTAKKLYIHRNTLQYRLEKIAEKTGINLKDFNSAFTMYLACLLHDSKQ